MLRPRLSPRFESRGWANGDLRDRADMPEPTQHHRTEGDPALLNAAEVAEILGVPPSWVYAEARDGRLPHVRVGRYRRFRRRAVDNWIENHERGPAR
jgi:excisionase family DNA binding protein